MTTESEKSKYQYEYETKKYATQMRVAKLVGRLPQIVSEFALDVAPTLIFSMPERRQKQCSENCPSIIS